MKNTYSFLVNGETAFNQYATDEDDAVEKMQAALFDKIDSKYRISLLANNYNIRIYDNFVTVCM